MKRGTILALGLALSLASGGCWDARAINDRATVLALAVAPARAGSYRWTLVFPNVATTISSLSGISPQNAYYSLHLTAPSLPRALALARERLAREVYTGHIQAVLFSPRLTGSDVAVLINTFNNLGTIRKSFWVAAGSPALARRTGPETVVPEYPLSKFFNCYGCQPFFAGVYGWQLWSETRSPGISPTLPLAENGPQGLTINRMAVFPARGPARIMDASATQGWAYLTGRVRRESIDLVYRGGRYTLSRISDRLSRRIAWVDGRKQVDARVTVKAYLAQAPPGAMPKGRDIQAVERLAAAHILAECRSAVHFATRTGTDPFGYGRRLDWEHDPAVAAVPPGRLTAAPLAARITVRVILKREGVEEQ